MAQRGVRKEKYMERYKGTVDIFFGIEHEKKEEIEEEFTKEVNQGWMFAGVAARIIDENASIEGCKHRSGWSLCGNCQ